MSLEAVAGDRIALKTENTPLALMTYVVCVQVALVYLPLRPANTSESVVYFVGDATPVVVIYDGEAAPSLAQCGVQILTLYADGYGALADFANDQP
jgi:malonyl-CoA/methylmalonyl-CoA synthetase